MRTILVVDDKFGISQILAGALEDEGYRVFLAGNGRRGLERLAEVGPDLMVLDFMMPVMDGAAMGRAMRADPAHAAVPMVMMSVVSERVVRERFDGYVAFLRKPFLMQDFIDLVSRTLGD